MYILGELKKMYIRCAFWVHVRNEMIKYTFNSDLCPLPKIYFQDILPALL